MRDGHFRRASSCTRLSNFEPSKAASLSDAKASAAKSVETTHTNFEQSWTSSMDAWPHLVEPQKYAALVLRSHNGVFSWKTTTPYLPLLFLRYAARDSQLASAQSSPSQSIVNMELKADGGAPAAFAAVRSAHLSAVPCAAVESEMGRRELPGSGARRQGCLYECAKKKKSSQHSLSLAWLPSETREIQIGPGSRRPLDSRLVWRATSRSWSLVVARPYTYTRPRRQMKPPHCPKNGKEKKMRF